MKCREFAKIVHELAQSRRLDETEAAIACAHAESCPACGCRLAEAERLAAVLREASADSRLLGAPERVESQLLAAFRAARTADSRPRWKPSWPLALGWAGAGAVISLIVFAWLSRGPARRFSPTARSAPSSLVTATTTGEGTVASPTPAANANRGTLPGAYMTSGFVPVPFAGGFARGDSDVIVRVQVPRAALAELGYPVDDAEGESIVQADLLVGEDGWPRAVRIVK